MQTQNNKIEKGFHAVEYMREVREKLSEQYLTDKEKYLEFVRKAMEEFKKKNERIGN
jgi:hypothetical protein